MNEYQTDERAAAARDAARGAGSLGGPRRASLGEPIRQTPISGQVDGLAHQAQIGLKLLNELESRLSAVIAPPTPRDAEKSGRREPTCELDERLLAIESTFASLLVGLEQLTARIRV